MIQNADKRCASCGEYKPLAEYSPSVNRGKKQLRSYCKPCMAERRRLRDANPIDAALKIVDAREVRIKYERQRMSPEQRADIERSIPIIAARVAREEKNCQHKKRD